MKRKICCKAILLLSIFTLSIMSVFSQHGISFRSNIQYPRILSNIWGYTDTITGKEYALVGEETGLDIVDVTDPDNPQRLFFIPTDTSMWQEPKTWGHYVYMPNEYKGGLLIIDLGNLPDTVVYTRWSDIPDEFYQTSHTCFVDEQGILYLNGSNVFNRGTLFCDLKPDPMNPVYIGKYDDFYVHDCFARKDTLYSAEILDGQFSVIDVSDKQNPQVLARQQTPFFYSHNVWPSEDSRFLFNTDEKKYATVTSYDISDLGNIRELDQYRHSDFDSTVPHNTYYRDGFLYTSYYRDGVTIVDAHRPSNLVEIGSFDTSPFPPGYGFEGCWGVYCFFPCGNIVCSDRQEGLFVLTPVLKRACYLEGTVSDQQTGLPLAGITVEIIGQQRQKSTDFLGMYKTGVADSGRYDVRFTDFGTNCFTRIVSGVVLSPGNVTTLNQSMMCSFPNGIVEPARELFLAAYPNVFHRSTTVVFQSESQQGTVLSLYDVSGKLIKQFDIETSRAEVYLNDDLQSGAYILQAASNGKTETIRIIKVD